MCMKSSQGIYQRSSTTRKVDLKVWEEERFLYKEQECNDSIFIFRVEVIEQFIQATSRLSLNIKLYCTFGLSPDLAMESPKQTNISGQEAKLMIS